MGVVDRWVGVALPRVDIAVQYSEKFRKHFSSLHVFTY